MNEIQKKILDLASEGKLNRSSLRGIAKLLTSNPSNPIHPQTVKYHISQLEKKGLLFVDFNQGIIKRIGKGQIPNTNLVALPILGSANCGVATAFADEYISGYLKISSSLLSAEVIKNRDSVFVIEASGDSMNLAKIGSNSQPINDGDYVIVDGSYKVPRNGDYILSVIDGLANIKRFFRDGDRVALVSESSQDYPPIFIDAEDSGSYLINGKVVQVVKKFELPA